MQKLNYNTKKAQRYIELYKKSNIYKINDAYKTRASCEKNVAERQILHEIYEQEGHGYKILSHSHFYFTAGWITKFYDYLVIETKSNRYHIPLPF